MCTIAGATGSPDTTMVLGTTVNAIASTFDGCSKRSSATAAPMFARFTALRYASLCEYQGKYGSCGPSGNQPCALETPARLAMPSTKDTSAGAYTGAVVVDDGTHPHEQS